MSGRYVLRRRAGAPSGRVVNRGLLEAARGGFVGLAGSEVSNEGLIYAQAGRIELATGERIEVVDFDGDGLLGFAVQEGVLAGSGKVENSGELRAQGGEVYLKGSVAREVLEGVVNNSGVIQASRMSRRGGKIVLEGVGGGVLNSGELSVSGESGERGGEVKLSGDWVRQEGEVEASGEREGGRVALKAKGLLTVEGVLQAGSSKGKGGTLVLEGERVRLGGESELDVSGAIGGGRIYLGGGRQGQDAAIENARNTEVAEGAVLRADALVKGDGGEVIVWAEEKTSYQGSISARGGEEGGDGGFAEVSAKWLQYNGAVDLRAPRGKAGKLLLDPVNVWICDDAGSGCTQGATNTFTDAQITTMLAGDNDVEISTAPPDPDPGESGDITFGNGVVITWPDIARTLTLTAARNISLAGTLTGNSVENSNLALSFGGTLDFSGLGDPGTDISNLSLRATGSGSGATLKGLKMYRVTGVNSGVLPEGGGNKGSERWRFSSVRNLEGTEGADNFSFWGTTSCLVLTGDSCTSDVSQSGKVLGGGGNDSLIGTRVADTVHFTLTIGANADDSKMERQVGANAAVTVTKFSGIEDFETSAGNDTFNVNAPITGSLRAYQGDDTFNVAAAFTGLIVGAQGQDTFNINADVSSGSGAVLAGDEGNDIFNFGENAAVTITGTVRGGVGEDTFNIRGEISLPGNRGGIRGEGGADTLSIFTGGQISEDLFYGEDGADELRIMGDNTAYTYTINSSGNTSLTRGGLMVAGLESVEKLFGGGSDADTLRVTGNTAATYTLGNAENTLAQVGTTTVLSFSDIEILEGGDGADTFNIEVAYAGDLRGGAGADTFVFSDSGDVGDVDGGAGRDSLEVFGGIGYTYTVASGGNALNRRGVTVAVFSNVEDLEGGDSFNISVAHTGNLSGTQGNDIFTITGSLTGDIQGYAGNDDFNITIPGSLTGDIRGGGGNDTFLISGFLIGDIRGDGGYDAFKISRTGSLTGNIQGGGGYDVFFIYGSLTGNIQGDGEDDTFNIFGLVRGRIQGNAGNDRFNFQAVTGCLVSGRGSCGSVAGLVDGGEGSGDVVTVGFSANPVKVTLLAAPVENGFSGRIERVDSGTATEFTGFAGINTIKGHVAQASANEISVAPGIVLSHKSDNKQVVTPARTLTYSNFEVFSGFALDFIGWSDAVTVELTRVNTDDGGFDGSYTKGGRTTSFEGISSLQGGSGSDTLRFSVEGRDGATFTVSGDRPGSLSFGEESFVFQSIENLEGGAGADTFNIEVAHTGNLRGREGNDIFNISGLLRGNIQGDAGADQFNFQTVAGCLVSGSGICGSGANGAGSINGGAGSNVVTVGFRANPVKVTLREAPGEDGFSGRIERVASGTSTEFTRFTGINTINGHGDQAAANEISVALGIVLSHESDDSQISYAGVMLARTLAYSNFSAFSGFVLDFSNFSNAVTVELLEVNATGDFDGYYTTGGRTTSFRGVSSLQGGSGSDTLQFNVKGEEATFTVSGDRQGSLSFGEESFAFQSIENLEGSNSAVDVFIFGDTGGLGERGTVDGRGEPLFSGGDTVRYTGAEDVTYSTSPDGNTLHRAGTKIADLIGVENLVGGDGADTFVFSGSGDVGDVDGGEGTDTLRVTGNVAYTYTVASSGNTLERGGAKIADFSNVENLEGGAGADTFNIKVAHTGNLRGREGNDIFNISGLLRGNIQGDAGDDQFNFQTVAGCLVARNGDCGSSAAGLGLVDGGEGSGDVVTVDFNDNPVKVTLLAVPTENGFSGQIEQVDSGTATKFTRFAGINTINGNMARASTNELSVAPGIVLSHVSEDSRIVYTGVTPVRILAYRNFGVF